MAYCTFDDMKLLLPETNLATLSADKGKRVNMTVIAEVINQADREIDSYVGMVAPVPLDPVPPLITNLSAKMAIWNLHLRKYFDSPVWQRTYDHCVEILTRIAQGKMTFEPEDETVQSAPSGGCETDSRNQRFTSDEWDTY